MRLFAIIFACGLIAAATAAAVPAADAGSQTASNFNNQLVELGILDPKTGALVSANIAKLVAANIGGTITPEEKNSLIYLGFLNRDGTLVQTKLAGLGISFGINGVELNGKNIFQIGEDFLHDIDSWIFGHHEASSSAAPNMPVTADYSTTTAAVASLNNALVNVGILDPQTHSLVTVRIAHLLAYTLGGQITPEEKQALISIGVLTSNGQIVSARLDQLGISIGVFGIEVNGRNVVALGFEELKKLWSMILGQIIPTTAAPQFTVSYGTPSTAASSSEAPSTSAVEITVPHVEVGVTTKTQA